MNESEAIDRLRSAGFHAKPKDWALGHSIFVGDGGDKGGITGYRYARYIDQAGDIWHVIDCVNSDDRFDRLEEALEHAVAMLTRENLR